MTGVLGHEAIDDSSQTETATLSVEFSGKGPLCVLTLNGELSESSIAALEVQIDQIGCSGCEYVIVDVSKVTAIDASGARVMVGLATYVGALGAHLTVSGAHDDVAEALKPTGLV